MEFVCLCIRIYIYPLLHADFYLSNWPNKADCRETTFFCRLSAKKTLCFFAPEIDSNWIFKITAAPNSGLIAVRALLSAPFPIIASFFPFFACHLETRERNKGIPMRLFWLWFLFRGPALHVLSGLGRPRSMASQKRKKISSPFLCSFDCLYLDDKTFMTGSNSFFSQSSLVREKI